MNDDFGIGRGRVQISVLVSNKPMWVLEKSIFLTQYIYILPYLLLYLFKAHALMLRYLIKTSCIPMKVDVAIIRLAHSIVVNIRKWAQPNHTI